MQQALAIDADGKFGPGTEKAVKAYQDSKGLTADGIAGPLTLATLNIGSASASAAPGAAATTVGADAASDGGIWDSVEEAAAGTFDKIKIIFGF